MKELIKPLAGIIENREGLVLEYIWIRLINAPNDRYVF